MKFLFWQTLYKNSLKSLSILLLFIVFVKLKFSKSNLIKSQLLTILLNSFDKNLGIGFSSSKCFEISKEFNANLQNNFIKLTNRFSKAFGLDDVNVDQEKSKFLQNNTKKYLEQLVKIKNI